MERPPKRLDDRIDLERSIALLPDGYRTVFVLHDVEGMKHEEIARRLGISTGTSKSQLSHGRKMLRALLCESRENGNAQRRSEPV
jgi:RNA polymerase sigma-70 factor (ECF subfamily)